ncbi:Protocadherin-15 [Hypsibius exemplaris]|uniref:Protocadherin-15 n=1 Tax=Hypsibius exemplaris TaxID=2072580 RepID=A0A9X6NBZ5_HYPEX|nr:Protocadherin-15 [Hypsibius exemplaris]
MDLVRISLAAGLEPPRRPRWRLRLPSPTIGSFWLLVIVVQLLNVPSLADAQLCTVRNGATHLTADVQTQPNSDSSTVTVFLNNIIGSPDEIELAVVKDGPFSDWFMVNGKQLLLTRSLTQQHQLPEHITLRLRCARRRLIPTIPTYITVHVRIVQLLQQIIMPRVVTISELTPVGTTVYQANPREFGRTGYTYSIVNEDVKEYFVVTDPLQGWIAVRRPLDFERQQDYNIKIRATDGVNTDEFVVTVRIQDSNDLDPAFEFAGCQRINNVCINPRYTATCFLKQAGGAIKITPEPIRAYDRDTLRYPIRYSFLPEGQPASFATYFRINPESGEVRQIRPLDQLDVKEFVIYVKAEELAPPGGLARSSVAQLVVNVRTQNSHRPVIRAPTTVCYIPENAPVGYRATISAHSQTPFQLTSYDADNSGTGGRFTYSVGGVYASYFQVTPDGYIQCIRPGFASQTSRENIKITITCQEQDTAEVFNSDPLDITIVVAKVNEHTPKLQQYNPVELKAGPPDGRPVVTVNAVDEDQGKDGQITYAIVYVQRLTVSSDNPTPPDARGIFVINVDTGVILQRAPVYKGEVYEIKVRATDGAGKFDEGIIRVKIVDDGRNEAPFFVNPSYVASIPEGVPLHYPVIVVTARDPDNEPLLYTIIGGNEDGRFSIDANTGSIHTMGAIDYEQRRSYSLVVQAKDPSGGTATTTVSILVNDINDNDPEFINPRPITFSVPENQAPLRVGIVSATDKDSGPNGDISYSIPANPFFRIAEKTGEITLVQPLDFERQQQHTLIVTARDNGISYSSDRGISIPSPRSATVVVTVNVIDSEDEDPTFIDRIYYAEVFENRPAGLEVVQVSATDPDTVKHITYTIVQGDTNAFQINPQSGVITTRIPLDYETTNRYQLIVGTTENRKNAPSSSATVYVNVLNENDVGPKFVGGPYVASIGRQAPLNTVIQTILARDGDQSNKITYAIEGDAKGQQFFAVDPNTGEIRVSGDLSRDNDPVYNLIVTARDSGNPPQTATSNVIINVINPGQQNAPIIQAPSELGPVQFALPQYQVRIREGANANTPVEELRIINKPQSGITNLQCAIVSGNADNAFSVETTSNGDCLIRVASGSIDFETRPEHDIVVQATGSTENQPNFRIDTRVAVSVVNVNDNAPQFIFPYPGLTGGRYFAAIDVNSNVGTPILKVSATDADKGDFGIVRYALIPSVPAQRFEINDESGLVSSRVTFIDSTPENEPFEFAVQARDSPNQVNFKAAAATVIINLIRDQNRFILVIEGSDAAKTRDSYQNNIVKIIQEKTGKVVGVEKITHRDILDGNRTRPDFQSTDMWMYAIDPDTRRIMTFLDLQSILLAKDIQERRLSEVQTIFSSTDRAVEFRAPYILPGIVQPLVYKTWSVWGFEAGLIALAALIILFCIIAIIILCYLWARYREYLKRARYQPRMEPVMFEPVAPEYETQILQMNVNEDDNADLGEVNVGFTPRAGIDSVTYIKTQQERERHMQATNAAREQQYRSSSAYNQSTNPIYDNPDHGAMTATAGYSTARRATAGYSSTTANSGQRVAASSEGINMAVSSLDEDDEERLMARSTLTSDQSRVVSSRHLRDDYEAPRSYSYSYAYSKEFAANGLNRGSNNATTIGNTNTTSSTASHL